MIAPIENALFGPYVRGKLRFILVASNAMGAPTVLYTPTAVRAAISNERSQVIGARWPSGQCRDVRGRLALCPASAA